MNYFQKISKKTTKSNKQLQQETTHGKIRYRKRLQDENESKRELREYDYRTIQNNICK